MDSLVRQAQSTNDEDKFTYSHGVFTREPSTDEADLKR